MKGYGEFCSVARALDLVGERWTVLVVRELLCGSRRFSEIRRGIPRISRTMLAQRLRELGDAGAIARHDGASGPEYQLTEAGRALESVVGALGVWGQQWLPRTLPDEALDVDALLWDMRRRVDVKALPDRPIVIAVVLTGVQKGRLRWLLLRSSEISLCTTNPGFPESLRLTSDVETLVRWWRGDLAFAAARRAGLRLEGPTALVRAFPTWFDRYLFAGVPNLLKV